MKTDVIILAAGQGTRMRSSKPKVLHALAGTPMLGHVVAAARELPNAQLHIVIGHGADQVQAEVQGDDIHWVSQQEQLGTGHAVLQAAPGLRDDSVAIVLYGDVPLIRPQTLQLLTQQVSDDSIALLTAHFDDPTGYGRIVRDQDGKVIASVEQKDASAAQLQINEGNTGFVAAQSKHLKQWLPTLSNDNAQGEYYLTDIIGIASNAGLTIATSHPESEQEVLGVNSKQQLIGLERWYQQNYANQLLANGITVVDPARFDVRGSLAAGADTVIDINAVFEGEVTLGKNVNIGPNCTIKNASIGDNTNILANTVIENAVVEANCNVGPFARLRPDTHLCDGAKVGNFVEMKKTRMGVGSKANHLAYVGDANVGDNCNIGAGTITCNYDGAYKHVTELGDNVFVGSNSTLVAPLKIEKDGFVGAGSTVTSNVKSEQLAIGRGKQRNIDGWKRPVKKT